MKERLKEIDLQLEALNSERKELCLKIANLVAQFSVGDKIKYKDGEIWEVSIIDANSKGEPIYFGSRLKKDGTPGKSVIEIWQIKFYEFVKVI